MARHIDCKDTAKLIRKQLKDLFPSTKFSVRIKRHSGSSSIDVSYQDGAAFNEVDQVLDFYRGKKFDGMTDMANYVYVKHEGEEVCFGSYVFLYRSMGKEFLDRVLAYCHDRYGNEAHYLEVSRSGDSFRLTVEDRKKGEWIRREASKIINSSKCDRVFNWEQEKKEDQEKEAAEREAIANQRDKDQQYTSTLVTPDEYLTYGTISLSDFSNDKFKVLAINPKFTRTNYYVLEGVVTYGGYGNHEPVPAPHTRSDITWHFVVEIKCEGESVQAEWSLDTMLNKIDPIVPVEIIPCDLRVKGKFACLNKNSTLDRYRQECSGTPEDKWYLEECRVIEKIILSPEHYDRYIKNLLTDFDWIAGKGGTDTDAEELTNLEFYQLTEQQQERWREEAYSICFAVVAEDKETILVNPEGYKYSAYVAFVDQSINDRLNQFKPSHKTVVDLEQDKKSKEAQALDNLYKAWVQELIQSDRLSEIIGYRDWLKTHGQAAISSLYSSFVQQCVNDGDLSKIMTLEDWEINNL